MLEIMPRNPETPDCESAINVIGYDSTPPPPPMPTPPPPVPVAMPITFSYGTIKNHNKL